jgi:hypothetical protein
VQKREMQHMFRSKWSGHRYQRMPPPGKTMKCSRHAFHHCQLGDKLGLKGGGECNTSNYAREHLKGLVS